ncbi:MFS transporter [Dyella solisilvae]|uniref:MFS transporter n=2 Tax=Dyella solisilvae TaxID=1920168 RepID=A0A370KDJ3_9GAMM|nr:MFS transporter [Dyella solisilvae]
MTAYYIIRPVRDQLSGAVGSTSLPLFYGSVFVVMLLLTPVFGALVAHFPRKRLLGWCYSFFIACLMAFVPAFLAQDRIGARQLGVMFFIWVSVFNLFVVSLFWSFMADIFRSAQARLVFPLIALGGTAGAIFGPMVTKLMVRQIGVAPLLVVSAVALLAAMVLLLAISDRHDCRGATRTEEVIGGSLWAGIKELWTRPFLRYMAILMVLGDGIGTLTYALIADYAKVHLPDRVERTSFYNDLDLYTNLLVAFLQLTFTPLLLRGLSATWALVVPCLVNLALLIALMLLGSGHVLLWGASVPLLAIVMVFTRGFAYGMTKPATDSLYTRVPRETRYKGKNFVETTIWRLGDVVITSGVNLATALGVALGGMAAAGALIAGAATWVAALAGRSPDLLPEQPAEGRKEPSGAAEA